MGGCVLNVLICHDNKLETSRIYFDVALVGELSNWLATELDSPSFLPRLALQVRKELRVPPGGHTIITGPALGPGQAGSVLTEAGTH